MQIDLDPGSFDGAADARDAAQKVKEGRRDSGLPSSLALPTDSGTRSSACGLLEQSCGSAGGVECVVLVLLAVDTVDTHVGHER